MCDVTKYKEIYKELRKMQHNDIAYLLLNAESKEMKDFFVMVNNYFLQQRQKQLLARKPEALAVVDMDMMSSDEIYKKLQEGGEKIINDMFSIY